MTNENESESERLIEWDDEQDFALGADLGRYTCTCLSRDPEDHLADCELWECWEFEHGWAEWDIEASRLVDVEFDETNAWDYEGDEKEVTTDDKTSKKTTTTTTTVYKKCRHYQQELTLPDGTVVYPSSHHWDRDTHEVIPDLGIYMDGCWQPDGLAFLVGCPDYGVPVPAVDNVLHVAREGLRVARDGGVVEVGCIGGHGRTGLMLAIMVLLTMDEPDGVEAVKYVRKNYCFNAVESLKQEWYAKGIAAELTGQPWPELPPPPPKPVFTYDSYKPSTSFVPTGNGCWAPIGSAPLNTTPPSQKPLSPEGKLNILRAVMDANAARKSGD